MADMIRWLALTTLTLSISGCPESGGKRAPPAAACAKRGMQCKLESGSLGVCNDTPCPAGREPPSLTCVSQH